MDCQGESCPQIQLIKKDMEHHAFAVNESTLAIKECVDDIRGSTKEVITMTALMASQNQRLEEGNRKFKDLQISQKETEINQVEIKGSLNRVWWFIGGLVFTMLSGVLGLGFWITRHLMGG